MMWNPGQYLKFDSERTQPSRDLAGRIQLDRVETVIDLGCGPGNSTAILRERWPNARVTGLDNSPDMIAAARKDYPNGNFELGDVVEWAQTGGRQYDVIFSNAVLHWAPDHTMLFPQLLRRSTGVVAVQMPTQFRSDAHRLMRETAMSSSWSRYFPELPKWYGQEIDRYYDLLRPITSRLDLWETEYIHSLPDANAIVEWYRGSGLRPYLAALPTEKEREAFLDEFRTRVAAQYPVHADGCVLLPFRRTFIVAYK